MNTMQKGSHKPEPNVLNAEKIGSKSEFGNPSNKLPIKPEEKPEEAQENPEPANIKKKSQLKESDISVFEEPEIQRVKSKKLPSIKEKNSHVTTLFNLKKERKNRNKITKRSEG